MFYEIEREIKFVFLVWPGVHYWFDPNNATPIYFYFYVTLWYQVKYWTPLTCLGREMVKSHELLLSLSRMGKSSSAWATWYRKRKNGLYTDNFSWNISSKREHGYFVWWFSMQYAEIVISVAFFLIAPQGQVKLWIVGPQRNFSSQTPC